MKDKFLARLAKLLMKSGSMKVCIIDDESSYFNAEMINAAESAGFANIERHSRISNSLFKNLHENPRDIIILDVKGVTDPNVAKDGLAVAQSLYRRTNTFVVITSAHQFYLRDIHQDFDYIIEQRLLTIVDFIEELHNITKICLDKKRRFYQNVVFRIGFSLMRRTTLS